MFADRADKILRKLFTNILIATDLAFKFRAVGAIEKEHEQRYRKLLSNVKAKKIFEKSGVSVWECRNCGHLSIGTKAPEVCPVCFHPQSYFEVKEDI